MPAGPPAGTPTYVNVNNLHMHVVKPINNMHTFRTWTEHDTQGLGYNERHWCLLSAQMCSAAIVLLIWDIATSVLRARHGIRHDQTHGHAAVNIMVTLNTRGRLRNRQSCESKSDYDAAHQHGPASAIGVASKLHSLLWQRVRSRPNTAGRASHMNAP